MRGTLVYLGWLGMGILVGACGSSSAPAPGQDAPGQAPVSPTPLTPTYSSIRSNILVPRCLSCHQAPRAQSGIDLSSRAAIDVSATTHGHGILVPGNPDQSHLFESVSNGSMPSGGSKLSDAEIGAIRDWIAQGAKDD